MIDGTLTLKRFADRAVASLFTSKVFLDQRLELEDAVRVGVKAGMGSRQNAPAEWIGE